jgi:hypothetical protein
VGRGGNTPRPSGRPAAVSSHGDSNRGTDPGQKSAPVPSSGRPRPAGGAEGSRHPRSRRSVTPGRSSG